METGPSPTCPRCKGSGLVCEVHHNRPMAHLIVRSGHPCSGAGIPCEEPGCPFRDRPNPDTARDPEPR